VLFLSKISDLKRFLYLVTILVKQAKPVRLGMGRGRETGVSRGGEQGVLAR
jgi:hypothetical protein